jgi:hypothetical protein
MDRKTRAGLVAVGLISSWFGMQAVHELGHVTVAWLTGGVVERVVLHPLTISRTDVSPNPRPLAVAWAGPIVGSILPLTVAAMLRNKSRASRTCAEFFAGFCLIANGAYIGVGSLDGVGDAGDMLRHGSPPWLLVTFGIVSAAAGLWVWHRLTFSRSPG